MTKNHHLLHMWLILTALLLFLAAVVVFDLRTAMTARITFTSSSSSQQQRQRQRRRRREELIAALKRDIHQLSPAAIRERFRSVTPGAAAATVLPELAAAAVDGGGDYDDPPPPRQDKIDHFVVLFMENHAFDNVLGCLQDVHPNGDRIDGIPMSGRLVPKRPYHSGDNPTATTRRGGGRGGFVNVSCGTGTYICPHGPSYDSFAGKFRKGTNANSYPYAPQSDDYSYANGMSGNPVTASVFAPHQLPVKTALANAYGIFNKYYISVPSMSTPNHLFAQSATSCGIHENIMYSQCGGVTDTFPQFTIYDSLFTNNVSFALYMNSSCGVDGNKPCHGPDPHTPDGGSSVHAPDVAMQGVGRHKDRFLSQRLFYQAAANGTLPSFSWLMPPMEACDHPCHDMAKGERLLKDIYEALRAGPKWNNTLFLAVYDDAGGYYDHIVPPFEGVPSDDAPCHVRSKCSNYSQSFDFRRLGLRSTAILMSPWVARASVFQEPVGPTNTSQFEHSSIPATVKNLFNLSGFLTKRDMWAGSFDELLSDIPREDADMPVHLPDAPEPAKPWGPTQPPPPQQPSSIGSSSSSSSLINNNNNANAGENNNNNDDDSTSTTSSNESSPPQPQHCGHAERICRGVGTVTTKQRNQINTFAAIMKTAIENSKEQKQQQQKQKQKQNRPPPPVIDGADPTGAARANEWLAQQWRRYMSTDGGIDKPAFFDQQEIAAAEL